MTDYPTAAEIQTTRKTLVQLKSRLGGPSIVHPLAYTALSGAVVVLEQLDQVPGLHTPSPEPEPEPKPTAAQVLLRAFERAKLDSVEESILWAAKCYAEAHPEWFRGWHDYEDANGSLTAAAAQVAVMAADDVASDLLTAAAGVAKVHPDLFGGAS